MSAGAPIAPANGFVQRVHETRALMLEEGACSYLLRNPKILGMLLRYLLPSYRAGVPELATETGQQSNESSGNARKTIWTYWDQGVQMLPDFNTLCISTWKYHCPDWDVVVVTADSVFDYLDAADLPPRWRAIDTPQVKSELIRLALIARYGGVWMDSSILLQTGLDDLVWNRIASNELEFGGFSIRALSRTRSDDVFETWFIAAAQGCYLVQRWQQTMYSLWENRYTNSGVIEDPFFEGVDLHNIDDPEYLCMHCALLALIQKEPACHSIFANRAQLIPADGTAFRWQDRHGRKRASALALLGNEYDDLHFATTPLLKFTGWPAADIYSRLHSRALLNPGHTLGRLLLRNLPPDFGLCP